MSHLSDEQLGALADGALAGAARAAAERHLESCARCREALAGLVALDRDLRGALEHDPGDAYFEEFAARVGGRIRAAGLDGAQARAPEVRGLADWFRSTRKLAVVGAVATVVVGAGIVMLSSREVTVPALRSPALERGAGQVTRAVEPPAVPAPAAEPQVAPPTTVAADRVTPSAAREESPPVGAVTAAPPAAAPAADEEKAVAPPSRIVTQEEVATATVRDEGAGAPPKFGETVESVVATRGGRADEGAGRALAQKARPTLAASRAESADAFAGQPTFTSLHGRNAERLTRLAETMRVAPAWDSAAEEWATVLLGTAGTPLETETRYQLARARWRAWQSGPGEKRAGAARAAFAEFLGVAPAGAQRDSVATWQAAVGK